MISKMAIISLLKLFCSALTSNTFQIKLVVSRMKTEIKNYGNIYQTLFCKIVLWKF